MTVTMDAEPQQRSPRSDRGKPRLTGRDLEVLAWLEDMRVISEADLAALLGRYEGRGPLSEAATRAVVRRWTRLQVAQVERVYARTGRYVWLTSYGAALVGVHRWHEPALSQLRHTAMVARVRLWLEARGIYDQAVNGWISERQWRQRHSEAVRSGAHVPDGVAVLADGSEVAVEVELHDKGPSRAMEIAARLTAQYERVLYVVPGETQTARTVRGAMEDRLRHVRRDNDGKVAIVEIPREMQDKPVSGGTG